MSFPDTKFSTEWVKFPNSVNLTFVGREVVAMGAGCHIFFYSLTTGSHKIYSATRPHNGDGVRCYAGHRTFAVLAFAEKCLNPRIIFIKYPDFEHIRYLYDGAPEGYDAIAFSDYEYFVSLSTYPNYEIVVWNWRNCEKLISEQTHIHHPNQTILCNYSAPVHFLQYYENATTFNLWEIHYAYKKVILIKKEYKIPYSDKIISMTWNPEGNFFILNKIGCIYMLSAENKLEMIIMGAIIGEGKPCFTWFKGGLAIMEPNYQIKHYKKISEWTETCDTTAIKLKQILASTGKDVLVGWTGNCDIIEIDLNKLNYVLRCNVSSDVSNICFLYPLCNNFVSLSRDGKLLKIWDIVPIKKVSTFSIEDKINTIAPNPMYPYIAAGLERGMLILISLINIDMPIVLARFNLYRKGITKVIFNETGNLIATANMAHGLFFIIRGLPGEQMEVISYIDYRRPTLDIALLEDAKSYKLFILVCSDECMHAGQRIIVKMVSKSSLKIKKKKYLSTNHLITNFVIYNKTFYGKIFGEKFISEFHLQKRFINFVNDHPLPNHPRHYLFGTNGRHIITYGFNGLLTIRNENVNVTIAAVLAHHRFDNGVIDAIVDPFMRYIISIGKFNEMVCTKINSTPEDKPYKMASRNYYACRELFNTMTYGFDPENDETYLEAKKQELIEIEKKQYAKERKQIMDEFLVLKKEVISLLNQNLNGPDLEKIDILEFYLHTKMKQYKENICEKECEWTVKYYTESIRAHTELWNYMKSRFWDTQTVKRCVIKGIFSKFYVENYGVIAEKTQYLNLYNYFIGFREMEEMLRSGDLFLPWLPKTISHLHMTIDKPPIIKFKSEETRIMEALEDDMDDDEKKEGPKENYPSSHCSEFIEETLFYEQEEIHTYTQIYMQRIFINPLYKMNKLIIDTDKTLQHTEYLIRLIFNKLFEEAMEAKRREMNSIIEKNNRLRFILSELRSNIVENVDKKKNVEKDTKLDNIEIIDPVWYPTEEPANLIVVEDWEIPIRPYISPSRQAILDWEAAEAERIRLLLLADDFREKALIRMMDGVLEVRWEDTLKRDIPKPKCMLEKKPENFNEEDLRAVRDYEDKVAFLNSERQRYKNMLESEYTKVAETVRESIKKFNGKLNTLLLQKIKIETIRSQHVLMKQLNQASCNEREKSHRIELEIIENIKKNDEKVVWITEKITELIEASNENKAIAEVFNTKDKNIEKYFKRDFQDYSALIQEQSIKLYKKQPKVNIKNICLPTLLNELATKLISQEKSSILPAECIEWIKSVDKLDEFVGIPNYIDESVYKMICKYRRMRLESELRLKAIQIEQTDIEGSLQNFQKLLIEFKEFGVQLVNKLNTLRKERLEMVHNKKLQIVIKKGLVEIHTSGYMSDYDTALMVDRQDIEHINGIILRAGERKLKVMKEKMYHRRQILEKEWEHKKKKMEIEDLKEYLYMVDKVKVTKEIQRYLRQKAKGETFDKGMLTLDQEIDCKRKAYEKMIGERKKAIFELDKQIKDYKKKNLILDQKIAETNIDVCEQNAMRDLEFEKRNKQDIDKRMAAIIKRSKLVKKIQEQHNEILVLQTELELARLKTYPTLKFKTLN